MFSLLLIKSNSIPKIAGNLLNVSRTFSQKNLPCKSSLLTRVLSEKPRIHYIEAQILRSHLVKRYYQSQYWKINTNVANNVILYKAENVKYFKLSHVFGICSIVWWIFQIWYLYKDKYFSEILAGPTKKYLEDNLLSTALLMFSTILGPLFYIILLLYSSRLIKYVILNKGGKHVTFITFHPLKSKSTITVPVDKVYCQQPRDYPQGTYTSVKVNSYRFNFLIDKSGTYVNGDLFDHTVAWQK